MTAGRLSAAKSNPTEILDLRKKVKDLDAYCVKEDPGEWELEFIASLQDLVAQNRTFSERQKFHINKLWEKFCNQGEENG